LRYGNTGYDNTSTTVNTYYFVEDVSVTLKDYNSIKDKGLNTLYKVYPNPTQNELTIEISQENFQGAVLRIYSITGQLVHSAAMQQHVKQLNLGAYPQGVYIVEISNLGGSAFYREKVVVK
jgi:hypothetical protein